MSGYTLDGSKHLNQALAIRDGSLKKYVVGRYNNKTFSIIQFGPFSFNSVNSLVIYSIVENESSDQLQVAYGG